MMNTTNLLLSISIAFILGSCSSVQTSTNTSNNKTNVQVRELLGYPFGTIVKLEVQIFDGEELNDKYHQSDFLFKVNSINDKLLPKPIIMDFKDETGKYPKDDFELYKQMYGTEIGIMDDSLARKIRANYFGRKHTIIAYESGEFSGIPDEYFKYRPVLQDRSFGFKNYLIVVADKTESK